MAVDLGEVRETVKMSYSKHLVHQMISRDAVMPISGIIERWAGSTLTIDLGAIKTNYRFLRDRVAPSECAGVVKADAYGLGASKVALALWEAGCRSFFVAHLCEAVHLRAALDFSASIYILNGIPDGAEEDCAVVGAIPVLNSVEQVLAWSKAAKALGRRLPAGLQTDSGMSLLGLSIEDIKFVASQPTMLGNVDVRLLLSHLACADLRGHGKNRAQLTSFEWAKTFFPGTPSSFANICLDLARHGLSGRERVSPTHRPQLPTRRASSLTRTFTSTWPDRALRFTGLTRYRMRTTR